MAKRSSLTFRASFVLGASVPANSVRVDESSPIGPVRMPVTSFHFFVSTSGGILARAPVAFSIRSTSLAESMPLPAMTSGKAMLASTPAVAEAAEGKAGNEAAAQRLPIAAKIASRRDSSSDEATTWLSAWLSSSSSSGHRHLRLFLGPTASVLGNGNFSESQADNREELCVCVFAFLLD
ncbi:unnamed protein product [Pseudo-nitzschia multistriata]|uniref:Uncharacterized protein n=1 Tax=Pseudo-nitzschia multistriata TaxID=183589 RepID=A0A448ZEP9_9STRA|nr:unnamed protein product [Pseudo-nitzschia multistriata]